MNVSDIMSKDVETAGVQDSLFDAAQKMKIVDAGVLPIIDSDGIVVGVLTDRDIVLRGVANGGDLKAICAGDVMTADPVTCRPDCPLDDAVSTMRERQIRRLVITEEHNKHVVGIISLGDIAARAHAIELVGEATEGVCQPA